MSDKVEVKKVLEFLNQWYEYYQEESKKAQREYDQLDPALEPARRRVHDMVRSRRHQAIAIDTVRTRFDLEFNYGLGVDNDDNGAE